MVAVTVDGRTVKVRHMRRRGDSGWYFIPSKALHDAGFRPEPLGKDVIAAAARAEVLNAEWDAIRAGQPAVAREVVGSWPWLVKQYEVSDWYRVLQPRSKETQDLGIRVILSSPLAKYQVKACGRREVRSMIAKLRETKSEEHVRKIVKVLRRLLNYAIELELIRENPAAALGIRGGAPRRQRWRPEHVTAFVTKAIEMKAPGWALAVLIAYDTAQRLDDVLKAQHGHFDGEGIAFSQGKTGKDVWCPLTAGTIERYREIPRRATTIVYGERGRPIASRVHFNRMFRKIAAAAELPADLQFRDLRRTAISEVLSAGGRAEPISGHAPGSMAIRVYEVPDKEASRTVMAIRSGKRPRTPAKEKKT